jgi:hypothetical protein
MVPKLAGSPVGVPPMLVLMVCTTCVDDPMLLPLVPLPQPTSVAARINASASTTRWRRRSLPAINNIPKARAVRSAVDPFAWLNGEGHINPA